MDDIRLIDANALYNDLKESVKAAREWKEEAQDEEIKIRAEQAHGTFCECALRVKNAPTIEAIPVIYGVILETTDINGKPFKYCSNCKYPLPESNVMNYCNCCGSDFRSPDSFQLPEPPEVTQDDR